MTNRHQGEAGIAALAEEAAALLNDTASDAEELLRSGLPASVSNSARTVLSSIARRSRRLAGLLREELDAPVPDLSFLRRLTAAGRPVALASGVAFAAITGLTEGGMSAIVERSTRTTGELAVVCAEADAYPDDSEAYGLRIDGDFYVVTSERALVIGSDPVIVEDGDLLAVLSPPTSAISPTQVRMSVDASGLRVQDLASGESTYLSRTGTDRQSLLPLGKSVKLSCGDSLRVDSHVINVV